MVNPDFSEFQFAYGMTRELEAGYWPIRASGTPYFPTQPEEADLGYDLEVSDGVWPVFVQYKRSKKLTRSNAREWDVYNAKYFRFRVETSDDPAEPNQHELLVDLGQDHPYTFYASSEFLTWENYMRYAKNNRINEHSTLLICGSAPTPYDGETHFICHRPGDSHGLFFSETPEPKRVESNRGYGDLFQDMMSEGPEFESLNEMEAVFSETRDVVVEKTGAQVEPSDYYSDEPVEWAGLQQRFFYETLGTQLLFMSPSEPEDGLRTSVT